MSEELKAPGSYAKMGAAGFAQMLVEFSKAGAVRRSELQRLTGVADHTGIRFIDMCHRFQRAHIECWDVGCAGGPVPRWRYGPGVDAPEPRGHGKVRSGRSTSKKPPVNLLTLMHILDAFEDGATRAQATKRSGAGRAMVSRVVDVLMAGELAHVCDWRRRKSRHGGAPLQVIKLGPGQNKRRPPPLSNADRKRAYQQAKAIRDTRRAIGLACLPAASVFTMAQASA